MSHTCEAPVNNQCSFPVISAKAPALAHPGNDLRLQVGVLPTLGQGRDQLPSEHTGKERGQFPAGESNRDWAELPEAGGQGLGSKRSAVPCRETDAPGRTEIHGLEVLVQ